MHIPKTINIENNDFIHQFIEMYSFGVIISEQLKANHLPFLLKKSEGKLGTLYGHFSKENRHLAKQNACRVMVVFQGPHSYISPTWYASSPAVPTWNYAAVYLHGDMELLSADDTTKVLDETVDAYEPELLIERNILTDDYRARLAKGVIGFKINIANMQGKNKLGQHRNSADQLGVVEGLQCKATVDAEALLTYMNKIGVGV